MHDSATRWIRIRELTFQHVYVFSHLPSWPRSLGKELSTSLVSNKLTMIVFPLFANRTMQDCSFAVSRTQGFGVTRINT